MYIFQRCAVLSRLMNKWPHSSSQYVVVSQGFCWTNASHGRASVIDILVAHILHSFSVNFIKTLPQFMNRYSPVIAQHLSANILTDSCGSIQLQEHVCHQKVLGTLNFMIFRVYGKPSPFSLGSCNEMTNIHSVWNKVETPESSICVAGVEGLEAVSQIRRHCTLLSQIAG